MPIGLTDEQRILRESAERFFASSYDFATRQRVVAGEVGFEHAHWRRLVELGWTAAPFAPALGGLGLGLFESAIIMRAIGASLFASPYFPSLQLAGRLVARRCATEHARALLAPVISGHRHLALATSEPRSRFEARIVDTTATATTGGYAISGEKRVVAWAEAADRIVVTARTAGGRAETRGISLFVIDRDAAGVSEKRYRTVDGHRASDIRLDGVRVPPDALLGEPDTAFDDLETVCDHASVLLAAEAVGCMSALRSRTLDYVKQREQFGRPIGKFQAVQHRLVDIDVEHDTAEAIAFAAAEHIDRGADAAQRARLASSAKAQVGWSGQFVGEEAVQLHGAIAMTNDLPVGHYLKRLTAIGVAFGDSAYHVRRFQSLDGFSVPTA